MFSIFVKSYSHEIKKNKKKIIPASKKIFRYENGTLSLAVLFFYETADMTAESHFFAIDKKLYPGYTGKMKTMKTAISLPDTLFEVAEQTAQYMGIPRSRLFAIALEDYLARHNGEMITQKLNEVYGKMTEDDLKEFERDLEVGLESLRELTKNDTW
jgi:hypothetical protein